MTPKFQDGQPVRYILTGVKLQVSAVLPRADHSGFLYLLNGGYWLYSESELEADGALGNPVRLVQTDPAATSPDVHPRTEAADQKTQHRQGFDPSDDPTGE